VGIKYLTYQEIDKKKWDECIVNAANTLIYAYSFYLDNCTAQSWDALVLNDYDAVMPLIYRKKYSIKYLYQPPFLQQSGIFFKDSLSQEMLYTFLTSTKQYFKFAEINLNYANGSKQKEFMLSHRNNFLLDLSKNYKILTAGYKSNFNKNIKKAAKHPFVYEITTDFNYVIDLYKKLYHSRTLTVQKNDYEALRANCTKLFAENNIVIRQAVVNKEILAAVILLKDANRLYNLASCVTEEGKKSSANYYLYDKIIEEFSNKPLILDLEGSDIKGIADFYKSMNPVNEPYFFLKYNNLPKLVKYFKK
jgi:hypothetical protein